MGSGDDGRRESDREVLPRVGILQHHAKLRWDVELETFSRGPAVAECPRVHTGELLVVLGVDRNANLDEPLRDLLPKGGAQAADVDRDAASGYPLDRHDVLDPGQHACEHLLVKLIARHVEPSTLGRRTGARV